MNDPTKEERRRLREALETLLGWSHCIVSPDPYEELDRDISMARQALDAPQDAATGCAECEAAKAERDRLAKELAEAKRDRDTALAEAARATRLLRETEAHDGMHAKLRRQEIERLEAEAARLKGERDRLSAALSEVRLWAHDTRVKLREVERENTALIAAWPTLADGGPLVYEGSDDSWWVETLDSANAGPFPSRAAAVRAAAKLSAASPKVATDPASGGGGESR